MSLPETPETPGSGDDDEPSDAAIIERLEDLVDGLMERIEEAEDLLLRATQGDDQFPALAMAYDKKWSSGLFPVEVAQSGEAPGSGDSGAGEEDAGENAGDDDV